VERKVSYCVSYATAGHLRSNKIFPNQCRPRGTCIEGPHEHEDPEYVLGIGQNFCCRTRFSWAMNLPQTSPFPLLSHGCYVLLRRHRNSKVHNRNGMYTTITRYQQAYLLDQPFDLQSGFSVVFYKPWSLQAAHGLVKRKYLKATRNPGDPTIMDLTTSWPVSDFFWWEQT